MLLGCHRRDAEGHPSWSAERRAKHRADSERFQTILDRMADLDWSREDHAWLARRTQGAMCATAAGRELFEREFKDAPYLMDGKRTNQQGHDGADHYNEQRLRELAA